MKSLLIVSIIAILIVGISITSISAQEKYEIPSWVKGVAGFWAEDKITDEDFGDALSFLITEKIIQIPEEPQTQETSTVENYNSKLKDQVSTLKDENMQLQEKILQLENDASQLENDKSQLDNDKSQLMNSLRISENELDDALDEISQLEDEISDLKKLNDMDDVEPEPSITVEVDRLQAYEEGDTIKITVTVIDVDDLVGNLEIINPDEGIIYSDNFSPKYGNEYVISFVTGDDLILDKFGKYVVKAEIGSFESETSFWYNPN